MVAALYVQPGGVYFGLPDVDPWDEARDARLYPGPHPVVAHPPCARWGRFWPGSPRWGPRYELGADGGCFASALAAVRRWGGVIEHPKDTHAWDAFGIRAPGDGWQPTLCGGWTCCVDQGHYGHPAQKRTWLYAVGPEPHPLKWGPAEHAIAPREGRDLKRERQVGAVQRMSKRRRASVDDFAGHKTPCRKCCCGGPQTCLRCGKSVHCLPAECWPDGSVTHAYWCEGCGPVTWSDGDPEMEDEA